MMQAITLKWIKNTGSQMGHTKKYYKKVGMSNAEGWERQSDTVDRSRLSLGPQGPC